MKKITKPGIYNDWPEPDYYADPCPDPSLTQSIAKILLNKSLLHAAEAHPRLRSAPPEDEVEKYIAAQAIGTAAHKMRLGRGRDLLICEFDDWKTKAAREVRAEAQASNQIPILARHADEARLMVNASKLQLEHIADVTGESILNGAFKIGHGEVMAVAQDGGAWLRTLIDWMIDEDILFDYKTTGLSANPRAVPRLMVDAGWPIQAAMQERILDLVAPNNAGRRRFFFILQENYFPYQLSVHELSEGVMTMGRKMVDRAVSLWRGAVSTGRFDGYPPHINKPEYPTWKETEWLNRELEEAEPGFTGDILAAG